MSFPKPLDDMSSHSEYLGDQCVRSQHTAFRPSMADWFATRHYLLESIAAEMGHRMLTIHLLMYSCQDRLNTLDNQRTEVATNIHMSCRLQMLRKHGRY